MFLYNQWDIGCDGTSSVTLGTVGSGCVISAADDLVIATGEVYIITVLPILAYVTFTGFEIINKNSFIYLFIYDDLSQFG